jgi:hypothetical protein
MAQHVHIVRPGESLWRIAGRYYGDPTKWTSIAHDNVIANGNRILVGQALRIRSQPETVKPVLHRPIVQTNYHPGHPVGHPAHPAHQTSIIPASGFFFIIAEEFDPLRQKVVRKVMVSTKMTEAYFRRTGKMLPRLPNPEVHGLFPTAPDAKLPIGRHAAGMKPSPYSSASKLPMGTPRFPGNRFWIDVEKAEAAGAKFHTTEEILADLDRIAAKLKSRADIDRIARIKELVRADREVLVRGAVPASAIKGAGAIATLRVVQGLQIVGFAITAYDLANATEKSIEHHSVKPIAAETLRQAGGWGMAWAGAKVGAGIGAFFGIESGPGAIVTGAVGAIGFGAAGYFGADWVADHIDAN